ncbi:MAG: tetraacyldisaccharide 4'-kinase [Alteromonadaceae bacterium]|jgi:tetraacyldisaccharide 4'-kinase
MKWIEQGWYNSSPLNYLLLPLSFLFMVVAFLRRLLFKLGVLKSFKVARPVVIVGNISVGGNGKTPFAIWLVERLQANNIKVGVISRGYGGKSDQYPIAVDNSLDTSKFGDEPVLIHKRTGCPVVVGPDRVKNCQALIEQFDCQLIISDDGMQHYRLQRDIEVAIVDAARQFGNGWLMPVGPLRELKNRLNKVDYVIYNGHHEGEVSFELAASLPVQVKATGSDNKSDNKSDMKAGHWFNGVCGIGNPTRFKHTVMAQGFELSSFTPYADHHHFTLNDFAAFGDEPVLMTEKDAVKCQAFARPNWWYLPVDARLPTAFEQQILTRIKALLITEL